MSRSLVLDSLPARPVPARMDLSGWRTDSSGRAMSFWRAGIDSHDMYVEVCPPAKSFGQEDIRYIIIKG